MLLFNQTIVGPEADEELSPEMIDQMYRLYETYSLIDDNGRSTLFDGSLFFMVPMSIVYGIICLTGLVSNLLVCIVIARDKSMHTPSNYYLFSLAISDLLLILGLPNEIYQMWKHASCTLSFRDISMHTSEKCYFLSQLIFDPWIIYALPKKSYKILIKLFNARGTTHCYLHNFLAETSSNASILTITAFTIERYLAIFFPLSTYINSSLSRTIKINIVVWILSLSLAIPRIISINFFSNETCIEDHIIKTTHSYYIHGDIETYFFRISSALFFFLPMFIITIAYIFIGIKLKNDELLAVDRNNSLNKSSQESNIVKIKENNQKNITCMLVVIVVAFFSCWAPFHARRVFISSNFPELSRDNVRSRRIYFFLTEVLYYSSSFINPLLYSAMSKKFRDAFKTMFLKKDKDQTKLEDFVLP